MPVFLRLCQRDQLCQPHTQNGLHVYQDYFFSSSSAARLGAGAIWSVTHKEGKEREIWDTRVALIKLDKNTTVQNYKKTNNSFTIFAVQLH